MLTKSAGRANLRFQVLEPPDQSRGTFNEAIVLPPKETKRFRGSFKQLRHEEIQSLQAIFGLNVAIIETNSRVALGLKETHFVRRGNRTYRVLESRDLDGTKRSFRITVQEGRLGG